MIFNHQILYYLFLLIKSNFNHQSILIKFIYSLLNILIITDISLCNFLNYHSINHNNIIYNFLCCLILYLCSKGQNLFCNKYLGCHIVLIKFYLFKIPIVVKLIYFQGLLHYFPQFINRYLKLLFFYSLLIILSIYLNISELRNQFNLKINQINRKIR